MKIFKLIWNWFKPHVEDLKEAVSDVQDHVENKVDEIKEKIAGVNFCNTHSRFKKSCPLCVLSRKLGFK